MIHARFCRFPAPLPYGRAVDLQKQLVQLRIADRIPDTFLLLQHPPVITLGRRGRREHLLVSDAHLQKTGIELHHSSRGGDITYHAPGQWVLYPILKLSTAEMGTHGYLHALEDVALNTARHFGVDAFRREGMAGAWCARGKFAAVGFAFTRWVSWHGLSLNVNLDLSGFDLIVGCGLVNQPVTSLEQALSGGDCPDLNAVGNEITRQVKTIFQREIKETTPENLRIP
jgi:lipoyl(octanoyl) transferase